MTTNTENTSGLSGLRVTRIISTARVILDDAALAMVAVALEQYAEGLDSRDDASREDYATLAAIVRNTVDGGGAFDMDMLDGEWSDPDTRTLAVLDALRERGAVNA